MKRYKVSGRGGTSFVTYDKHEANELIADMHQRFGKSNHPEIRNYVASLKINKPKRRYD